MIFLYYHNFAVLHWSVNQSQRKFLEPQLLCNEQSASLMHNLSAFFLMPPYVCKRSRESKKEGKRMDMKVSCCCVMVLFGMIAVTTHLIIAMGRPRESWDQHRPYNSDSITQPSRSLFLACLSCFPSSFFLYCIDLFIYILMKL